MRVRIPPPAPRRVSGLRPGHVLMSAGNKVLSGSFPQGLADALNDGIKNNPNTWYTTFLQQSILPHSVFYGYLIEWTEMVIAIFLLGGAFILVSRSHMPEEVWYGFGLSTSITVAIVAAIGAFLTVNFHFGVRIMRVFSNSRRRMTFSTVRRASSLRWRRKRKGR